MKLTSWLVALTVLTLVINGALALFMPPHYRDNSLQHAADFFRMKSQGDSWYPMQLALDFLNRYPGQPLYSTLLINRNTKFQYPPPALLIRRLLNWLDIRVCAECSWRDLFGWFFMGLTLWAVVGIHRRSLRDSGLDIPRLTRPAAWLQGLCLVILTLMFYPVIRAYTPGQIQVWLTGLFAAALLCWMTGRKGTAGVLLGWICLVKPQMGLFIVWGVLRKEWRFAGTLALTVVGGLAASVWAFGLSNHLDYLNALSFLSRHGESFRNNQSFNGLANRLCGLAHPELYNNVEWRGHYFPPFTPWVYGVTLLTSLLLLGLVLWRRRGERPSTADFCAMALGATMASPIAWEHHYGILVPIFAFLAPRYLDSLGRQLRASAVFILTGTPFAFLNALAQSPFNVLQSHVLFGGCLVLWILLRIRNEPGIETPAVS